MVFGVQYIIYQHIKQGVGVANPTLERALGGGYSLSSPSPLVFSLHGGYFSASYTVLYIIGVICWDILFHIVVQSGRKWCGLVVFVVKGVIFW